MADRVRVVRRLLRTSVRRRTPSDVVPPPVQTGGRGRPGKAVLACASVMLIAGAALSAASALPAPPPALHLDPFYARYVDAGGIPVVASPRVPDDALTLARRIVLDMTAHRPVLRRRLGSDGYRIAVMAPDEGVTDLPEQRDWKKPAADDPRLTVCERRHYAERIGRLSDRDYWNGRARGMGGILTSAGAENLLALPGDRYHGENIFVHEFSHALLQAVRETDRPLYARVERAYADAMAGGLWRGEYAGTTVDEYWAEGTQFWFNSNRLAAFGSVRVLSDTDLARYDPALARVLAAVYGATHHLPADRFWNHPDRVPPGPPPPFTAEVC